MSNTEEMRRRIDALENDREAMAEMNRLLRQHSLGRSIGGCVGDCRGNMANLDCAGLAREKAATIAAQRDSQLAAESYKRDPAERTPPAGYTNATNADLDALGLRDPDTGESLLNISQDSNFNAAVFKDQRGNYVIGFKGTDFFNGEDWTNNVQQSDGQSAAYYRQAISIGDAANRARPGQVRFVGHSLGGGLASAASRATGRPATTFNAAGLHPNTVPRTVGNPRIDAWYVHGEVLNRGQGLASRWKPQAAGRHIRLNPKGSLLDISPVLGAGTRHLNYRIQGGFEKRLDNIGKLQREKGCAPGGAQ